MNERIGDLLERASDDEGAPIGFSGDAIVRRARARRHRRRGVAAVGLTAAGVAGVLVATQLAGSSPSVDVGPTRRATSAPSTPSSSPARPLSPQQQAVVDQCARQHLPAPAVTAPPGNPDAPAHPGAGTTVRDSSTAGPGATFLRGWTLDASVQDDLGLTAAFVNPAHTRWAGCDIAAGDTANADGVFTGPLPTGPVPHSWFGPDGFRHQGSTVAWSQVCAPGEGKVCARELFAGALVRYDDVASVVVDAPDGTVLHPVLGNYTYVFRHVEQRAPRNRASNDVQPLPSMPVTLLDAHGDRIIRYDYFPPQIIPGSCPSSGGC